MRPTWGQWAVTTALKSCHLQDPACSGSSAVKFNKHLLKEKNGDQVARLRTKFKELLTSVILYFLTLLSLFFFFFPVFEILAMADFFL